jgi:hypothetical protein
MKDDFHSDPIVFDGMARPSAMGPSTAEVREYIVAMIDQLSELADDNGEALIGAMLAEVARRCQG